MPACARRTARRSARGRAAVVRREGMPHVRRRARAPWRLVVYRHAARGTLPHGLSHGLPPRPPPGRRHRRRDRHPAVPARRCSPARWPPPTSGSTSTAPTSRSSRSRAFLLAVARAGRASSTWLAAARAAARCSSAGAAAVRDCSRWPSRWALLAARGLARRPRPPGLGRAWSSGSAARRSASGAVARRCSPRVRRRLDAEAAATLPLYARGRRRWWPAGSRSSSRRWRCSSLAALRVAAASAAAGARARSTPACASCGERRGGRRSSSSSSSTP